MSLLPDGRVADELKRRWEDGTTHLVMTPEVLVERLLAPVPRPRRHLACITACWDLLRRVFEVEMPVCPHCDATRRVPAAVTAPESVTRVLGAMGLSGWGGSHGIAG